MTATAQLGFDFTAAPKPKKARAPKPPRVKMTPQERAEQRARDHRCASCGLSWHDGCERPDWSWIDVGFIGMTSCARCGREVCHHCYARYESDVLCPECWRLPKPTPDEAEQRGKIDTDGTWTFWRWQIAWRYAKPANQTSHISPPDVWFWQHYESWRDLPEKVRDARYSVCTGHTKPKPADAVWMPEWMPSWLAARDAAAAAALDDK